MALKAAPTHAAKALRRHLKSKSPKCGIAVLSGKSLRERAEAMAAIAHPDFRDELADSLR